VRRNLLRTLIRFGIVGGFGFLVDAGVLHLLVSHYGIGLLLARAGSFLCAATATWAANRAFTFSAPPRLGRALLGEWAAYFVASLGGGAVNYLVFAVAIRASHLLHDFPTLAVALGTLVGMIFNFLMYSQYVFKRPVS
jgi:putative flippase GtrA